MGLRFAKRMEVIKASEIREILKIAEKEEIISFAGGLPTPELFPIDKIKEVNRLVLEETVKRHFNIQQQKAFFH